MKVAFFGTPDIGIGILDALLKSRHEIVAIVSQPDKIGGRGHEMIKPPVAKWAIAHKIPLFQEKSISKALADGVVKFTADIIITCAFGQILKQNVLDHCPRGVINIHFSLLPKYRGASPINFAIINGDTETGVTIAQTELGLDCGDILKQIRFPIHADETAGELYARCGTLCVAPLLETLDEIERGTVSRNPQDHARATKIPMIKKADAQIDFSKSPHEIVNFVRGMNPWPCAFASSNHGDIRVHRASVVNGELRIDVVQPAGGRPMPWRDFINGHKDFKWVDK